MDSRGYGRSGNATPGSRRLTGALMIAGMLGLAAGCYGLLDATSPRYLGLPAILSGAVLCTLGLTLGSRRVTRTHYRPDRWAGAEWLVAACGIGSAVLLYLSASHDAAELEPAFSPLRFPSLPLLPVVAILLGLLAAFIAPPPEDSARPLPRVAS